MKIMRRIGYFIGAISLASFAFALGFWNVLLVVGLFVLVIVVGFVLIEILERRQIKIVANRPARFEFAGFIPDGLILIVTSDGVIERYASEHWTRLNRIDSLPAYARLHALSADGCFLAWAIEQSDGGGSSVSLSEIKTGNQVRAAEFDGYLSSVLISPDGRVFGLVDHIGAIHLWDGENGEPVPVFSDARSRAVGCRFAQVIAFSPDGRFFAAGEEDAVYVWDFEKKELVQVLGEHSHISALSYNPDGTLLAVADDGKIQIWDPDLGEKLRVVEGLHGVQNLIFSPDGRFLVGDNNTRTLWIADVNTGARLADFYIADAWFRCLSFSPDSRQILALSEEARLYRWLLDEYGRLVSTEMPVNGCWLLHEAGRLAPLFVCDSS